MSEYLHKEVITVDVSSEFYAREMPSRAGEILGGRAIDTINSNAKLKAAVPAFKQTYSLKEGIVKTLDAYKAQGYQKGIDWSFDGETDRVIKRWCEKKGIKVKTYNTHFVDYFHNASIKEKVKYILSKHEDSFFIKRIKAIILKLK